MKTVGVGVRNAAAAVVVLVKIVRWSHFGLPFLRLCQVR